MSEERKKEDIVKCINGELYYLGDYANFLYEKLDEKDKEIKRLKHNQELSRRWGMRVTQNTKELLKENEQLHSIIKEVKEYIQTCGCDDKAIDHIEEILDKAEEE